SSQADYHQHTPRLRVANFTGRDYVRRQRRIAQQVLVLHRQAGLRMRLTPTRRKKPPSFPSTEQFLLVTGLFSAPQRYSQREFCYASRAATTTISPSTPAWFAYPFTVRVFSPISPLASSYFAAIV